MTDVEYRVRELTAPTGNPVAAVISFQRLLLSLQGDYRFRDPKSLVFKFTPGLKPMVGVLGTSGFEDSRQRVWLHPSWEPVVKDWMNAQHV